MRHLNRLSAPRLFPALPVRRAAFGLVALLFASLALPLFADDADSGIELVIGAGISRSNGDTDSHLTALGLRAHRWLDGERGAEISYLATEDGYFDENSHYLDLSYLHRLSSNSRYSTVFFGGVGAVRYRTVDFASNGHGFPAAVPGDSELRPTAHVGVGFHLRLGDRFYFRPDLRARRHFDSHRNFDSSSFDANLGFGWRF